MCQKELSHKITCFQEIKRPPGIISKVWVPEQRENELPYCRRNTREVLGITGRSGHKLRKVLLRNTFQHTLHVIVMSGVEILVLP